MGNVRNKNFLDYRPVGKRRPGRPLKKLLNGYNFEAETGHLLASLCNHKNEGQMQITISSSTFKWQTTVLCQIKVQYCRLVNRQQTTCAPN